jgi:hypothetical protein
MPRTTIRRMGYCFVGSSSLTVSPSGIINSPDRFTSTSARTSSRLKDSQSALQHCNAQQWEKRKLLTAAARMLPIWSKRKGNDGTQCQFVVVIVFIKDRKVPIFQVRPNEGLRGEQIGYKKRPMIMKMTMMMTIGVRFWQPIGKSWIEGVTASQRMEDAQASLMRRQTSLGDRGKHPHYGKSLMERP